MALTQDQISAARDFINKQWGGSYDSSGQFQQGSAFNANGQYNFNPNDTLKNSNVLGAGQAFGYSNDDMSQILGYTPQQISNYGSSSQVAPLVDSYSKIAQTDRNSGFYQSGQVPSGGLQNTIPQLRNAGGVVSNPTVDNGTKTVADPGNGTGNPGPGYFNSGSSTGSPYGPPTGSNGSTQTYLPFNNNGGGMTPPTGALGTPPSPGGIQTYLPTMSNFLNGSTTGPTGPSVIDPNPNPSVIQSNQGGGTSTQTGPTGVTPKIMASSPATDPTYPSGSIPAPAPTSTGPSASDISNYWNSNQDNPGLLNSSMNQYGVSPEQVASATGLGLDDILNKINPPTSTDAGYSWNPKDPIFSNGYLYTPIYDPSTQQEGLTQATKPIGYEKYKYDPAANDNQTLYNGQPYTTVDDTGKQTGSGKLSGFSNSSFMSEFGPFLMVGAGFTAALAAGAGVAAAGGAATDAGATVGGTTAGSTVPSSFGVVDDSVASLGAGGGGTGGGLVGSGLNVTPGTGLDLSQTTSSISGLSPSTGGNALLDGAGLTTGVVPSTGGLGLNSTIAGNSLVDGAGLTGGPANGSGTLLPPSITDGGYTMNNGTIVPNAGSGGNLLTTPPTTPPPTTTPPGTTKPPVVTPPGSTTGGGSDPSASPDWLSNIIKLLGGAYDSSQQSKASKDMIDYLKSQQSKIDNLYAPGSPEANYLWDAMSRKDAAAGRNSQYGPRSVDLASRIAQIKADDTAKMTTGVGALYAAALNKGASSDASILAALGSLTGSGSGGVPSDIAKWLKSLYTPNSSSFTPDTTTPDNSQNFQPDGGDLGQYF